MVGSVVFNRLLLVPLAMGALYLFGGLGEVDVLNDAFVLAPFHGGSKDPAP